MASLARGPVCKHEPGFTPPQRPVWKEKTSHRTCDRAQGFPPGRDPAASTSSRSPQRKEKKNNAQGRIAVRHGHCIVYVSSPFEAAQLIGLLHRYEQCEKKDEPCGHGGGLKARSAGTQTPIGPPPRREDGRSRRILLAVLVCLLLFLVVLVSQRGHVHRTQSVVCNCPRRKRGTVMAVTNTTANAHTTSPEVVSGVFGTVGHPAQRVVPGAFGNVGHPAYPGAFGTVGHPAHSGAFGTVGHPARSVV